MPSPDSGRELFFQKDRQQSEEVRSNARSPTNFAADKLPPRRNQEDSDNASDSDCVEVVEQKTTNYNPVTKMARTRANMKITATHAISYTDRIAKHFLNPFQLTTAFGSGKVKRPGITGTVSDESRESYEKLFRASKKQLQQVEHPRELWERTVRAWCEITHKGIPEWIEHADLEIHRFMVVMVFKGWEIPNSPERQQDMPAFVLNVSEGYAEVKFLTSTTLPPVTENDGEICYDPDECVIVSTIALLPASVYPLKTRKFRNFRSGYLVGRDAVLLSTATSSGSLCRFPTVYKFCDSESYFVAVAAKHSNNPSKEILIFMYQNVRPESFDDQSIPLDYDTTTHKFRKCPTRKWNQMFANDQVEECKPMHAGLLHEDW